MFISGLENLSEYSAETGFQFTELIQVLNSLIVIFKISMYFFLFQPKDLTLPEPNALRFKPPALVVPVRRCPLSVEDDIAVRDSFIRHSINKTNAVQKYLTLRKIVDDRICQYDAY